MFCLVSFSAIFFIFRLPFSQRSILVFCLQTLFYFLWPVPYIVFLLYFIFLVISYLALNLLWSLFVKFTFSPYSKPSFYKAFSDFSSNTIFFHSTAICFPSLSSRDACFMLVCLLPIILRSKLNAHPFWGFLLYLSDSRSDIYQTSGWFSLLTYSQSNIPLLLSSL